MFKGRIVSRSNINGKVHTFQKDFDDYDTYQTFVGEHPEYTPRSLFGNFWTPFAWDSYFPNTIGSSIPTDMKYLPEGIDLEKYEKRRREKQETEVEKQQKKLSLERSQDYLEDYLEENPDDSDAKSDLEKVKQELQNIT